ncbi:hypothetical protein [Aeromicrobium sp. HA]|nr:hypothetical protein [Aeromicrobium sp. HA]
MGARRTPMARPKRDPARDMSSRSVGGAIAWEALSIGTCGAAVVIASWAVSGEPDWVAGGIVAVGFLAIDLVRSLRSRQRSRG